MGFMNLLLGARMDAYKITNDADNTEYSNVVICPRINLQFKLSDQINIRTSYAKGYRAPQIFDEDLHIEASTARTITHQMAKDLKEETSNSYLLSADWNFNMKNWKSYLLVEGFYNQLNKPFRNDYIQNQDNADDLIAVRVNAPGADIKGVNLEFKLVPSALINYQMGLTFQNGKYDKAINQGENTYSNKMLRSPNRYGYFMLNTKLNHHTNLSFNGTYTGSMHLVHLGGGVDRNDVKINESLIKTIDFFDFGMKISYHFDFGDRMKLELNAGAKNLFNSFQKDADYGNSRDATYVYGPISPRTIFFGIKIGNF